LMHLTYPYACIAATAPSPTAVTICIPPYVQSPGAKNPPIFVAYLLSTWIQPLSSPVTPVFLTRFAIGTPPTEMKAARASRPGVNDHQVIGVPTHLYSQLSTNECSPHMLKGLFYPMVSAIFLPNSLHFCSSSIDGAYLMDRLGSRTSNRASLSHLFMSLVAPPPQP
jgi:hypothetical protein